VLGFSALKTGVTFLATAGTAVLTAGIAQALATRIGPKPVMMTGFALLGAGMLWYTQISPDGTFGVDLLAGYLLVGVGIPFAFIPVSIIALAGVVETQAGLASGLINTAQQIGGAIGVAVASTVATTHFETLALAGDPSPVALTGGFSWGFWVIVGFAAAGLALAAGVVRREALVPVRVPV
jgi:MFS-type transporter involved in bile tolerance (Atg22 family)